jgi:hypothetical protein
LKFLLSVCAIRYGGRAKGYCINLCFPLTRHSESDAAAKYPNCNSVQTFAVVEEKELLAVPQTGECVHGSLGSLSASFTNQSADLTRADLIMVDQYSVRRALDRGFPEQILIGLIRMVPSPGKLFFFPLL